jgi:hypothetical protein
LNRYLIKIEHESCELLRRRLHQFCDRHAKTVDVNRSGSPAEKRESKDAPAHDAFTRLLQRLEPDAETLWQEAQTQVNKETGILVLDDSTLDKPFSKHNALRSRGASKFSLDICSVYIDETEIMLLKKKQI